MMTEGMEGFSGGALTPEQERTAWQILRRCDAYDLLWDALDAYERDYPDARGSQDVENARDALHILREGAETARWAFKQRHGIPEA